MQKRLLLLFLASALSAFGQSNYAVVTGTITDPQHLPDVGAAIQLTAASTGAVRHVVTDQRGLFEVSALLPDDYELTTEAPGFAPTSNRFALKSARNSPLQSAPSTCWKTRHKAGTTRATSTCAAAIRTG